jgi:hypothetical protein
MNKSKLNLIEEWELKLIILLEIKSKLKQNPSIYKKTIKM